MRFQKGQSGNPRGRRKGARGRTTEEVRRSLLKLLDDNLDRLQKDLGEMKPRDRATILVSLAKHCTPPAVNPERLTEEQIRQIIEFIKSNENTTDITE